MPTTFRNLIEIPSMKVGQLVGERRIFSHMCAQFLIIRLGRRIEFTTVRTFVKEFADFNRSNSKHVKNRYAAALVAHTFSCTLTILVAALVFDKSYFPSLTKNAFGAQLFGGKQAPFEHVNRTGNIFTHITIHLCLHTFSNLTADDGLHSIEKMLGCLRPYHYYPNLYLSLLALTLPSPRGLLRTTYTS